MSIASLDIRQQKFKVRFRGLDVQEVDEFLNRVADELSAIQAKNERLSSDIQRLKEENKEYRDREETFKRALVGSQKILEQMRENARKSAEIIISNAEVKAEKMLNRAHTRLAQLHEDIAELKRQRIQLESQIRSILEVHSKLLEEGKEEMTVNDEEESKLTFLKPSV
jgi:cell division initiation protein